MWLHWGIGVLLTYPFAVFAYCDDPTPAFPLPNLDLRTHDMRLLKEELTLAIKQVASEDEFNATSFSLAVTSTKHHLFSLHHTADIRSKTFPGTQHVDGKSLYRIASMTKPFTVLAILQQHAKGNLHLDDVASKYIPALNGPQNGSIPWQEITVRALASQISGIPRDLAQQDLASQPEVAVEFGLPPVSIQGLPQCDSIVNYTRHCSAEDLTGWVKSLEPLFAPNQKSTYSNINYDLLSLVIENVTGISYPEYVQTHILDSLKMRHSTFDVPDESTMVIPAGVEYYWNFDVGVQKATGGLYSSTDDLSEFLRYALTHYNALSPVVNWFQPTSWANSMQSFYGMPWEIFRSNDYLPHSTRPITFVTKGGGLPGYTSIMVMVPEYGIGVSILVAGNGKMLARIRDIVIPAFIKHADDIAQETLLRRYSGHYKAAEMSGLNSSISLSYDRDHGLVLDKLVSNGTDALSAFVKVLTDGHLSAGDFTFYTIPTLLYQDEAGKQGERWRVLLVPKPQKQKTSTKATWDNFCSTDIDFLSYGGLPVNELVFWGEGEDDMTPAEKVGLTGFRVVLHRICSKTESPGEFNEEL